MTRKVELAAGECFLCLAANTERSLQGTQVHLKFVYGQRLIAVRVGVSSTQWVTPSVCGH